MALLHLSERLIKTYMNTDCLQRLYNKYTSSRCEYYLIIKKLQDAGKIVPDYAYSAVSDDNGACGVPEIGYYIINFHYNFTNYSASTPFELKDQLEDGLANFLYQTHNTISHAFLLNIQSDLLFYLSKVYNFQPSFNTGVFDGQLYEHINDKEKFLLDLINFLLADKDAFVYLNRLHRQVYPELYDAILLFYVRKKNNKLRIGEMSDMKLGVAQRQKDDKKKPTRHFSSKQEKDIAKATGGHQVANSGAGWLKGDVLTAGGVNTFLLEAKTKITHADSISLKKEWFDKNKKECLETGKQHSAIVFNFGPGEENHYIIDEYLFQYLQQRLTEEKESI